MLKVWGRTNSVNVQKVMWCIGELGLEYERTDAGMEFGVNSEQWFEKLNPNARVPVIDDNGFVLSESHVIVRYLAAKHDFGGLYPEDLEKRAQAEKWMDWTHYFLHKPLMTVFLSLVRTAEDERDLVQLGSGIAEAGAQFDIVDRHLAENEYVAGSEFSIGDFAVGACAYRWIEMPFDYPKQSHLERWYESLRSRSAFREMVMLPLV
jgi:glutathione S-transferase